MFRPQKVLRKFLDQGGGFARKRGGGGVPNRFTIRHPHLLSVLIVANWDAEPFPTAVFVHLEDFATAFLGGGGGGPVCGFYV